MRCTCERGLALSKSAAQKAHNVRNSQASGTSRAGCKCALRSPDLAPPRYPSRFSGEKKKEKERKGRERAREDLGVAEDVGDRASCIRAAPPALRNPYKASPCHTYVAKSSRFILDHHNGPRAASFIRCSARSLAATGISFTPPSWAYA